MPADLDVLERSESLKQLHQLKCAHEPSHRDEFGWQPGDVVAIKYYSTLARRAEPRNGIEQSRLAGSVRPDDRRYAAGRDLDRDRVERKQAAKPLGSSFEAKEAHALSFGCLPQPRRES